MSRRTKEDKDGERVGGRVRGKGAVGLEDG